LSGYEAERRKIQAHAEQIQDLADAWKTYVETPIIGPETSIDPIKFTEAGIDFAAAYESVYADYVYYLGQMREELIRTAAGLSLVARTYGETEAEVAAEIQKLESQPIAVPPSPPTSGLRSLLDPE
jgi:hypothetical protein